MTINVGLTSEIQKLAPSAIIELFELDCTSLGGDLLTFHAGTNELSQNIVWGGNTYVRFPIQVTGFEFTGQNQFPRPTISVSNQFSVITLLTMTYGDLLGAKLTRIRTLAKFIDAVNFESGVNLTADPTAEFESDVYFIDRKSSETRDLVQFELAAACDLVGVNLPRRQIIQNVCPWLYRGPECGFTGGPLYDKNDQPIPSAGTSQGIALIAASIALQAATLNLANLQAALSTAAQNQATACAYVQTAQNYAWAGDNITPIYGVVLNTVLGTYTGYFAGSVVTLGSTYTTGASKDTFYNDADELFYLYAITTWGIGAGCTAATSAYTTALSARDAAQTALITAQATYDAAVAAMPPNDPLFTLDQCGKRLTSCKLRFGSNAELPFGSFPAVGLFS